MQKRGSAMEWGLKTGPSLVPYLPPSRAGQAQRVPGAGASTAPPPAQNVFRDRTLENLGETGTSFGVRGDPLSTPPG